MDDSDESSSPATASVTDVDVAATAEATTAGVSDDPDQELDPEVFIEEMLNKPIDEQVIAAEYADAEKYNPKWFNRSAGWNGQTYDEAVDFCVSKDPTAGSRLCPYEVICPTGPHHIPYGGMVQDPNGSWAPMSDSHNDWVQIGPTSGSSNSNKNMCLSYMNTHLMEPTWGLTGEDNEEITRYVLCCTTSRPPSEVIVEAAVTTTPESQSHPEYAMVAEFEPVLFDRSSGWDGQTYDAAVVFCASKGPTHGLCPYEAYCPMGENNMPYGDFNDNELQQTWAPIRDSSNDWVQIGKMDGMICKTYMNLNLVSPTWGISGEGNEDITRYIMCCANQGGDDESIMNEMDGTAMNEEVTPPSPAVTTTTAAPMSLKEEIATEIFNPIWYDRFSGWDGQTYDEAVSFCISKDPKQELCPFQAYCPEGNIDIPHGNVWELMENNSDNPEYEYWAPISNSPNDWVQVGKHQGNICSTYVHSNHVAPSWGVTGIGSTDVTGYLMCCRNPGGEMDVSTTMLTSMATTSATTTVEVTTKPTTPQPSRNPTDPPTSKGIGYELDAETYEPIMYGRSKGWTGQTYKEGVEFCNALLNGKGEPMMLCPYKAYCPLGEGTIPYGGIKEEGPYGSWAPIINDLNHWVELGNERKCMLYTTLYPDAPAWGITGENNEEITRHVMCCHSRGSHVASGGQEEPHTSSPASSSLVDAAVQLATQGSTVNQENGAAAAANEEPPASSPTSSALVDAAVQLATQGSTVNGEMQEVYGMIYSLVDHKLQPVVHDRMSGWTGQTYDGAHEFCGSKESKIPCTYESLCPNAIGGEHPIEFEEGPVWAPIEDSFDIWVEIREGGYCKKHANLEKFKDVTRYVLCCKTAGEASGGKDHGDIPFNAAVQLASQGSTVNGEFQEVYGMIYSLVDHKLQPVVHDRMSGWTGQTYVEAYEFCGSKESKIPCTYESLCPNDIGGEEPIGFEEGPIWAPIEDSVDTWVEISDGGYCEKHTNLQKFKDVTRYVLCCRAAGEAAGGKDHGDIPFTSASMPAAATTPMTPSLEQQPKPAFSAAAAAAGAQISLVEMENIYKVSEERFRPVGYDRFQGWTGQTYGGALEFCALQDSKIPCPYEAICPMGSNGPPVGGENDGPNGAWAPIMDSANGWVQIGHKDTCTKYADMKPHPPMWGLSGKESEAITPHIKCCDEPEGSGLLQEEVVDILQLTQTEGIILSTMHPMWFGRKHGYHGTTHEESEIFCRTVADMHLCPIEAYCPNGPLDNKVLFLQKDAFEGEQWAPISSYDNEDTGIGNNWIMVGTKDGDPLSTCSQYEQLYDGKSPPWTADGSKTELKEHVLCCAQQESMKHEHDISRGMKPIWLDNSHGWSGGSYDDAVKFCQDLGRKRLCPYAAYCPHGPGMQPMGEHSADFNLEGEQWAPVFGEGEANNWVLIGRKYDNSATTCYSHQQLEGSSPDWGWSSGNSGAKRHIQCCSF
eukprot:CAMPEP_0202030230 /NCGR_PEP_ID=MMETSP0905-20130828/64388_1 /ASSEMBLY_ACC=CAM_ASM_000554 /TAXON_ID=420261 /ORGANISM="Thalassiosira antarctica, Strain CCMP982" /LENGTH=1463 /DNA_ID=CAMNT_0048594023 /DNA_START=42 /DNA_END=4433 /DNA_ORIENTATION=-